MITFRATILLGGKTATGIPVPSAVIDALAAGKRPAVVVTIGSYNYRSTIGAMDGQAMIPLSAEHRAGAGVNAGDEIEVGLTVDTEPRTVDLPADFEAMLTDSPVARARFDTLSPSNKKRIVLSIESAKTDETRRKRLDKEFQALTGEAS